MSVLLLAVSLPLVITVYLWFAGTADHRRGTPGPYGSSEVTRKHGRVLRVTAGVDAPSAVTFELRRETGFDRLATQLKWSVEAQVGHDAFDRTFYLASDDPAVVAWLRRDATLCDHLLELTGKGVPKGYRLLSLTCAGGQLRAQYTADLGAAPPDKLVGGLLRRLHALARRLPRPVPGAPVARDPRRRLGERVLAIAFGLMVGAQVAIYPYIDAGPPHTIDRGRMWLFGSAITLAVVGTGVVLLWERLGGSSRAHTVLAGWLVVATPSVLVLATAGVREANIAFDRGDAFTARADVVGAHTQNLWKFGKRTFVHLERVPDPFDDAEVAALPMRLQVQFRNVDFWYISNRTLLVVRRGALGLRWVERVQPLPELPPDAQRADGRWRTR
jgi:hypothetical protein